MEFSMIYFNESPFIFIFYASLEQDNIFDV